MAKKIAIWNERMLILMEYCKSNCIRGVQTNQDFLKKIGDNSKGAVLKPIREGRQSFQHEHFQAAGKLFNVSMDWFFGFTDTMKRENSDESVPELLHQAIIKLKREKV